MTFSRSSATALGMDAHTLRTLEFDKVTRMLSRYALTAEGKRQAESLCPFMQEEEIRRLIAETSEMRRAMDEGLRLPLRDVEDVRAEIERAAAGGGPLGCPELLAIASTLRAGEATAGALLNLSQDFPYLRVLGQSLPAFRTLRVSIEEAIDRGGFVADTATPRLSRLRKDIARVRANINQRLASYLNSAEVRKYVQFPNVTFMRGRSVIPVISTFKGLIDGIVHGTSDSGATAYMEPSWIVPLGNELSSAMSAEAEEIRKVLWKLTHEVGESGAGILHSLDVLSDIDMAYAKARMSDAFRMSAPTICPGTVLRLRGVRHPLLLALSDEAPTGEKDGVKAPDADRFEKVVPIDIHVGDDFRILLITGPNTGGKTVALKTVGLACLMAWAGMHVCASGTCEIPLYQGIYADIGDEQSIEQSLSTFSSHISRIIEILRTASRNTFVLLDELGAGTDPAEGAALGLSILEEIRSRETAAIVTTHLGDLKLYAGSHSGAQNASVDFDLVSLKPTYRLSIGEPGNSNALQIASRLGMPDEIIRIATEFAEGGKSDLARHVEEIQRARLELEERREKVEWLEQEAQRSKEEYREKLDRLKGQERKGAADVAMQTRESLVKLIELTDERYEELRSSHKKAADALKKTRDGLRSFLKKMDGVLDGRLPKREIKAGDEVYIPKIRKWGEVAAVDRLRNRYEVKVGNLDMTFEAADVTLWEDEKAKRRET
ncbi:MAG TPA: DNA strand exchange inhibitor protein [Candidatus Brocadiia bacterium]|nr:DNA strand exchange inhibitor protein [Candidatus Brocadiia bacterium]